MQERALRDTEHGCPRTRPTTVADATERLPCSARCLPWRSRRSAGPSAPAGPTDGRRLQAGDTSTRGPRAPVDEERVDRWGARPGGVCTCSLTSWRLTDAHWPGSRRASHGRGPLDMTQTTSSEMGARLRAHVRGQVWQEHDDGYDDARRVWNGAVDTRPAAVVRCVDADDVRPALLVARESGVPLSVRGGGHDWAGRALGDGGVVLDLSAMRGVELDPGARVAAAQGGALVADVVDPAAAHGLGTATAVVRTVGMAGMTLAGGYGGLVGRFGLALDNLLSADVLLPDGTSRRRRPGRGPRAALGAAGWRRERRDRDRGALPAAPAGPGARRHGPVPAGAGRPGAARLPRPDRRRPPTSSP